jgi:hypothetical protein
LYFCQKLSSAMVCCSRWWTLHNGKVQQSDGFSAIPVCRLPFSKDTVRIWAASVVVSLPQMQHGKLLMN